MFQVESRAQMATLPRLRPRKFYDIVIEVALIRPGPIQGGSVHPYINRARGREEVTYLHPLLEKSLGKTLGVPLFQEQLMQMAMDCAGFDGSLADQLRRAMGSKRSPERMEALRARFMVGANEKGVTADVAHQIFDKLKAFSDFGFPESHSFSFAYLVYASCWLKVHKPAAFYAGLLAAQPMGFYSPAVPRGRCQAPRPSGAAAVRVALGGPGPRSRGSMTPFETPAEVRADLAALVARRPHARGAHGACRGRGAGRRCRAGDRRRARRGALRLAHGHGQAREGAQCGSKGRCRGRMRARLVRRSGSGGIARRAAHQGPVGGSRHRRGARDARGDAGARGSGRRASSRSRGPTRSREWCRAWRRPLCQGCPRSKRR